MTGRGVPQLVPAEDAKCRCRRAKGDPSNTKSPALPNSHLQSNVWRQNSLKWLGPKEEGLCRITAHILSNISLRVSSKGTYSHLLS